jgi:hypothetical protein
MGMVVAIFLVVMLFRAFMRHQPRRVVQPAVQVIIMQPAPAVQVPTLAGLSPTVPVRGQYSRPFTAGFLGVNRQN